MIEEEEARYFKYTRNDPKNILNRPEHYDDDGLMALLLKYLTKLIGILI